MEDIDDPHLIKKIAEIKKTLQTLGTSFTEEDKSSENSSFDDSFQKKFNFHSPQNNKKPQDRSLQHKNQITKPQNPEDKPLNKINEVAQLKQFIQSLNTQLSDLTEALSKREKEVVSLKYQVDSLKIHETQLQISLKNSKIIEENLRSEIRSLKLENKSDKKEKNLTGRTGGTSSDQAGPLNPFEIKKFDFHRLRIPENLPSSPDPPLTDRQDFKYKSIFQETMRILGVKNSEDLFARLSHLKTCHGKYKESKKIVEKISNMMIQCSPEGIFKERPNNKQIWKWIIRLLEEYMKLKKSLEGEILCKIKELVKVDLDYLYEAIRQLVYKSN